MFDELVSSSVIMMLSLFGAIIALMIVGGWMFMPRPAKTIKSSSRKLKSPKFASRGGNYTIFHSLVEVLGNEERQDKREKRKERSKITDYRPYWNSASAFSQLSEEERKEASDKFFELLEKSRKENVHKP